MLSMNDALALVLERAKPLPAVDCDLGSALGLTLAGDVFADADQPPFDKALVDGFAVRSGDLVAPPFRLDLGQTILAGQTPQRPLGPRQAATITTGAPLPPGADAVVMHERTRRIGDAIEIEEHEIHPGLNRLPQGKVYRAGDRLLTAGARINPAALGVLAAVGAARVRVLPRPRVAIVPTGDELVDFRKAPGPGRIRNSNAIMLGGLVDGLSSQTWTSPILGDEPEALKDGLRPALDFDVVLVMGGVSAGQKDLVPDTLQALNIEPIFHKVRIKPGKPLWFGVGPPKGDRPGPLVFGLPGNPLSVLVNFLVFVRPVLRVLAGCSPSAEDRIEARLASRVSHRDTLTTHLPARILRDGPTSGGPLQVEPVEWSGSADLLSAAIADGFLILPEGRGTYEAGEIVGFLPLR